MVYMFLADGFEECEALVPYDFLKRCEVDIKTVGVDKKLVTGAKGTRIYADITDADVDYSEIDMIILPGGMPGTINLENSKVVLKALKYAFDNGRLVGAICAAPSILGHNGYLRGRQATCFPGFEQELKGADFVDKPVVVSENVITSKGMGTAFEFAFELGRHLVDDVTLNKVITSIQYARNF